MVRGQPRVDAILAAATELLAEVGYHALTMDAVAARAHASKTTIYRRWRNKAELVKAALDAQDQDFNDRVADTGSLRGDLVAVLRMLRAKAAQLPPKAYHELAEAMREDQELAALIEAHLADDDLSPWREPLQRAVARGELPAGFDGDLVHDVAEAMILRQLQLGDALDDAFVDRLVDDVLLVLLTRGGDRS
ncbi:TetR/AcrR family transcriptional regulator [Kitasatospora sp. NPDC008050]|uniref:TetR/AcrR family transcriptional regulator n=1 Tax=Kitasatospora sp. NPDC008050 TaxID=3364021 RepID=UPI0036F15B92